MLENDIIRELTRNSPNQKTKVQELENQIKDLKKEKEYYRKDAIFWEYRAKRYKKAYIKLKEQIEGTNEENQEIEGTD